MIRNIRSSKAVRELAYLLAKPSVRGTLRLDPRKLEEIRVSNREFLRTVNCWIREPDYQASIFRYGLPQEVRSYVDRPMTEQLTYSDIISLLARERGSNLRYLEIGVSVGKNFAQVMRNATGAELTAFDIESINPVLEQWLTDVASEEWPTQLGSMRKAPSRWTEFRYEPAANKIFYLAGDVFDPQSWKRLEGRTYNLIFSDAFHSGEALAKEWDMIKTYRLLAPEGFTMLWDDLADRGMRSIFYKIVEEMRDVHGLAKANAGIKFCRGWLGENAPYHPIGFIHMDRPWR